MKELNVSLSSIILNNCSWASSNLKVLREFVKDDSVAGKFLHNFDMGSYVIGNAIALAAFASIVIFKKHATIGTHSLTFWVFIAMCFPMMWHHIALGGVVVLFQLFQMSWKYCSWTGK